MGSFIDQRRKKNEKMKLVVDTNILFSFFWEESLTRKILTTTKFELITPEIAFHELKKYSDEIMNRLKIDPKKFNKMMEELKSIVLFLDSEEYEEYKKEGKEISPDEKDAEFLALCLKYDCWLWSNDSALKNQNKIKVISTEEIVDILFS